jgi:hypothetical protein
MKNYKGYTYPKFLQNKLCWYLWKRIFCKRGWHLWDEVSSLDEHYLYCDACECQVEIHTVIQD